MPRTGYRVWLRSVPGPMEQYDGHVDVWFGNAVSRQEAVNAAKDKLKRTSFPDRGRDCWRDTDVEVI